MQPLMRKFVRDSRKTLIWTAIGVGVYVAMIMSFFPTIAEQGDQFNEILETYPEEIIATFYSGDIADFKIDDPAIFLQTEAVIWIILIMGGMITQQVLGGTINAERENKMDLLLSLPVSRREVLLGRVVNSAVFSLVGLTAIFLPVVLVQPFMESFHIAPDKLALGIYTGFFLLMVQASLTFALTSISPSHTRWAGPLAFTYFFGAYLLMAFAPSIDWIDTISPLFIFKYYNMAEIINNGLEMTDVLVMAVVSVALLGVAFWRFEKKEIAV
ncbi:MAG: ABC transporter permease [Chloroflexi bacterium]|nr:ABC transporter permease [Chloroflexota bacterium]